VILVDTSVWVDYFNGVASPPAEQLDRLLGEEFILLGDLVLTEILQGFSSERAAAAALEKLRAFTFVSMVGWEIAVKAAENYRVLRRKGVTVRKTIDLWIGTFCIEYGCRLLHNDRDFQPMVDHLGLIAA
jgi:predicted nucleic acid-binding protein